MIKRRSFKKCWAALIIVCMLASFIPMMSNVKPAEAAPSTLGESFGFDNSVPEDFDPEDGKNPYGVRAIDGNWVNFNPVHELGIYLGEGEDTAVTLDAPANWLKYFGSKDSNLQGWGANLGAKQEYGASIAYEHHHGKKHVNGVAFDPDGCGHDNYAVYYGFDSANRDNPWVPTLQIAGPEQKDYSKPFDGWFRWVPEVDYDYGTGLTAITAGDFDGDGKDTLIAYSPDEGKLVLNEVTVDSTKSTADEAVTYESIQILEKDGKSTSTFGNLGILQERFHWKLNDIQYVGKRNEENVARNTPMVHLTAGNVDNDEAEELVATVSLGDLLNEHNKLKGRASTVVVFDKVGDVWEVKYSQQMEFVYVSGWENGDDKVNGTGTWFMRRAASSIGDVDGDGQPEIITVGTATGDYSRDSDVTTSVEIATLIECNDNKLEVITTDGNGNPLPDEGWMNPSQKHIIKGWKLESAYPYYNQSGSWYSNLGDDSDAGIAPVSLACVQLEGRGTQDYVVADGLVYQYDATNNSNFRQAYYGEMVDAMPYHTVENSLFFNSPDIMSQPVVGNFDGNPGGREQVFFLHANETVAAPGDRKYHLSGFAYVPETKADTANDGGYEITENPDLVLGVNNNGNIKNSALRICDYKIASDTWDWSMAALTAVDAYTDDGMMAQLKSKSYEFSDVEVMAVLEAPPAFGDLSDEYDETGGTTSFGLSTGSTEEEKKIATTRAGTYVNFEHEFEVFGVPVAGVEMGTAYENEMTTETERENTWQTGFSYQTNNKNHQVVLYQTPVIEYLYDVVDPQTGKKSVMHVNRPQEPEYRTMTLEEYNAMAEAVGKTDEMIGTNVLESVPGEPTSYRKQVPQIEELARTGTTTAVSTGMNAEQYLEESKMTGVTTEMLHSVDINGGGSVLGVTVGVSGGVTTGSARSHTETKSLYRGGTVAGVDNPKYGFSWEFISWNTTLGKGDKAYQVPVLGYLVTNAKQPPSLPKGLDAIPAIKEDKDHNKQVVVNLSWDRGYIAASKYNIYRYVPSQDQYILVETVDGDLDSLEYTNVAENTEYHFCIQAVDTDGTTSVISEPVSVFTPTLDNTTPIISTQPQDVDAIMGQTANFTIGATIPAGVGTANLALQWQSRAEGSNAWRNVTGVVADQETLTLKNVQPSMDGNQYRCEVALLGSGGQPTYAYSNTATLSVRAANTSKTDLTLSQSSGKAGINADYEVPGSMNKTLSFECTEGGKTTTYQRYQNKDSGGDDLYYCVQDQTYYTIPKWDSKGADDANEEGIIKVSAPTNKTALQDLTRSLADGNTILTTIDKLRGETKQTETIGGIVYDVVSATAVVGYGNNVQDGDLKVSTETFYENAGQYYIDRNEDGKIDIITEKMKPLNTKEYPDSLTVKEHNWTFLKDSVTETYIVEPEENATSVALVAEDDPDVKVYQKVTWSEDTEGNPIASIDSTIYYKDEACQTPLTVLSNVYGIVKDGSISSRVDPADKLDAMEMSTTDVINKQIGGDEVTLTANVTGGKDGQPLSDVMVVFLITNTATGDLTTVNGELKNGKATATWTPSAPGEYKIVARYSGDDTWLPSSSAPQTYFALDQTAGGTAENPTGTAKEIYVLAAKDALYGDSITGEVKSIGEGGKESPVDGATIQAFKDGTQVKGWTNGGLLLPGEYDLRAKKGDTSLVNRTVHVDKRAVTVVAPKVEQTLSDNESIDLNAYQKDLKVYETADMKQDNPKEYALKGEYGAQEEGYPTLFKLEASNLNAQQPTTGNYPIKAIYANSTAQDDFLTKYIPTVKDGRLKVAENAYKVEFGCDQNGKIGATYGSATLESGDPVAAGGSVSFNVKPNENYSVAKWTVKAVAPDGKTETELDVDQHKDIVISEDRQTMQINNLSSNIKVHVTFSSESHHVTFGTHESGHGTLTATNNNQEINTGTNVTGGTDVKFEATPESGYVVKQWAVKKESESEHQIQKNEDGSTYTGTTLTLTALDESVDVVVTFEEAKAYKVTGQVVDTNGKQLAGVELTMSGTQTGLPEDKNALSGATIEFKVGTLNPGQVISKWQVKKSSDEDFTDIQSSDDTYILHNVQADTEVRVVINQVGSTKHELIYEVVGAETGEEPGTLKASSGQNDLPSGESISVGTPVNFIFEPKNGYEVVKWTINGEDVENSANKTTHKIDSFAEDTEVIVTVQKMSKVTINEAENGTTVVKIGDKTLQNGDFVPTGSTITVTMAPDTGYVVGDLEGFTTGKVPQDSDERIATLKVKNAGQDIAIAPQFTALAQHHVVVEIKDTNGEAEGGLNGTLKATKNRKGMAAYSGDLTLGSEGNDVHEGSDITLTATPAEGCFVKAWFIDDQEQDTVANTLEVKNVTKDTKIVVQFEKISSEVYVTAGANGKITGAKVGSVDYTEKINAGDGVILNANAQMVIEVKPDTGYEVASWMVNGIEQEGETGNTFTFTATDEQRGGSIRANFRPIKYNVAWEGTDGTVTATVGDNAQSGTNADIRGGEKVTFEVAPAPGKVVSHWTVNGQTVEGQTDKTFEWTVPLGKEADTDYTIGAVCKENNEKVTLTYAASPEEGGTVSVDGGKDGKVTVTKGSNVTFSAKANGTYYIQKWIINDKTIQGTANQETYTLKDVQKAHNVEVVFAKAILYKVGYEVEGGNGTLAATLNGEDLTLDSNTTQNVESDSTLTFTANPDADYMLKEWQISTDNGKSWTTITRNDIKNYGMKHPLDRQLTVEKLSSDIRVKASFEQLVEYAVPTSGEGVLIEDVSLLPQDSAGDGHVRKGGDLSFTIKADGGNDYANISKLTINGNDLLNGGTKDNITVTKNKDGSYKVTITDVEALNVDIEASKLKIDKVKVPEALEGKENLNSVEKIEGALQTKLDAEHKGSQDGKAFYDIALQYWDSDKADWVDVTEENFPEKGIDVVLPYPDKSDKADTFTVLHMLAYGDKAGNIEVVQNVSKQEDGLHFHVYSLSPFAVCWEKYVSPSPGPGPMPPFEDDSYDITLGKADNGTLQADVDSAKAGDTVTLTATPDEGYVLDNLVIYGAGGQIVTYKDQGDGTYTFTMPDSDVSIIAVFKIIQGSCDGGEDCPSYGFTDVDITQWYHDAVDYVIQHGLMVGVNDTTFGTNMPTNRGMIVTILHRLEGSPVAEAANPFVDVAEDSYYVDAIAWAAENGIVSGYDANHFGPDDAITREQMASILYRFATYKGMDTTAAADLSGFSDVDKVSEWAKDTLAWANAEGFIVGADNKLDPQGQAVRCQSAAILMRFVEHTNE